MNKYQEALDIIHNAMYEYVFHTGFDGDGQPVEHYLGDDYQTEIKLLQQLIDDYCKLEQENERLTKSNDARLTVIKELRAEVRNLCAEIDEMKEQEQMRIELEYESGEDY